MIENFAGGNPTPPARLKYFASPTIFACRATRTRSACGRQAPSQPRKQLRSGGRGCAWPAPRIGPPAGHRSSTLAPLPGLWRAIGGVEDPGAPDRSPFSAAGHELLRQHVDSLLRANPQAARQQTFGRTVGCDRPQAVEDPLGVRHRPAGRSTAYAERFGQPAANSYGVRPPRSGCGVAFQMLLAKPSH